MAALPEQERVALTGIGATLPYPLYAAWFNEYAGVAPVRINYRSEGSPAGVTAVVTGSADFGASDVPVADSIRLPGGAPLMHVPTAIGAVALTYQLPGLRRPLRLSGPTIAGIFSGKITRWDDARIREENPEATLPSLAVQPVHRSDGSGTADIFRRYLRLYTKAAATGGGETVGVVRDGNEAVVAHVKATPGAVAYVEVVYARQNRLPVAHLQNRAGRFVSPMPFEVATAATNVLDALAPLDDEGRSGFRVSLLDAPGAQSYPLASFTWMLVAPSRLSPEKCRVLNAFLHWALETAAPTTAMLGYVALPTEVANRVLADVDEQLCCGSCAPPSAPDTVR